MWNMNVYIPTSEANVHAVERKEQIIVWERSRAKGYNGREMSRAEIQTDTNFNINNSSNFLCFVYGVRVSCVCLDARKISVCARRRSHQMELVGVRSWYYAYYTTQTHTRSRQGTHVPQDIHVWPLTRYTQPDNKMDDAQAAKKTKHRLLWP